MKNNKRIAVTGANGYLGYNVTKHALENGWKVHTIVRREEVVEMLEKLGAEVFIVKNFDIASLRNAFAGCDVIFHFANVVCGSSKLFTQVNIEGLKSILKASKLANVSKIIYPSGLGVEQYNKTEWAQNDYFRTKNNAEKIIKSWKINYVIFRPSYILGPHDELIPEIINQIVDGEVIIAGDGEVPMQPIFIKDAVAAMLSAASKDNCNNKIFNLVGPLTITMNKLVDMVVDQLNKIGFNVPNPEIIHIPYEEAPEKLDICKDMVDVMQCDLTPDGFLTAEQLGIELSELKTAINAAVNAEIGVDPSLNPEKRAIILLSGGIDSVTSLYWGINQGYDLIALSLLYKWRAKNEIKAARKIASLTNTKLIEVSFPFIQQATDLKMEGYPIPSVIGAPQGFIPVRNLLFYSVAAYYAQVFGCKFIIGGHIKNDTNIFPDTSSIFFKTLNKIINMSKHESETIKQEFLFPLINLNKNEVIELGKKLNVPFEYTWSCYGDFDTPCKKCLPCLNRTKAFLENQLTDPTFKNED